MALNAWRCAHRDVDGRACDVRATGVGTAYGLRAIGWYFEPSADGGILFCPFHRPDGITCLEGQCGERCGLCRGELEAQIRTWAETPPGPRRALERAREHLQAVARRGE
jgi:hypothetical protein